MYSKLWMKDKRIFLDDWVPPSSLRTNVPSANSVHVPKHGKKTRSETSFIVPCVSTSVLTTFEPWDWNHSLVLKATSRTWLRPPLSTSVCTWWSLCNFTIFSVLTLDLNKKLSMRLLRLPNHIETLQWFGFASAGRGPWTCANGLKVKRTCWE